MECFLRSAKAVIDQHRHDVDRIDYVLLDRGLNIGGAAFQYVVGHFAFLARMPNAKPQAEEVRTTVPDDIAQTVVTAVAATHFEARGTRRQIDFIMRYQELTNLQAIVVEHAANGGAAEIHIALRLDQPHVLTTHADAAIFGIELLFEAKAAIVFARQRIHKPETGVVQCTRVLILRISEAGDDANRCCHCAQC